MRAMRLVAVAGLLVGLVAGNPVTIAFCTISIIAASYAIHHRGA